MSLFGNTQNRPTLFTNNSASATGGSLFGSSQPSNSLLAPPASSQPSTTGLFGTSNQNQPQQNSLFRASNNQQQPPQQNSLFASNNNQQQQQQQQQQPQQTSLFGASNQQQNNSIFAPLAYQTQQQPQQQNSIFGASNQNQPQQQQSIFASTNQQPQQSQQLGASRNAPVWNPGSSITPREKTIPDQMMTLMKKWSPDTPECYFQYYFYNNVGVERVPYYGPAPGEDEQKWDDALAKKPDENAVPVLCKGFKTLGERLHMQLQAVQGLQARLHEINNSLTAQQQGHDLDISVRAADAKRRHVALGQRCLQLATKVQVLRNRGYVMDSGEEALKKKLVDLEKSAFDPSLGGRQDEVWARLVGIRERARLLRSEFDKTATSNGSGSENSLDEEVLQRTKKILGDYDSQISHLHTEIAEIRKDFQAWEGGSPVRR